MQTFRLRKRGLDLQRARKINVAAAADMLTTFGGATIVLKTGRLHGPNALLTSVVAYCSEVRLVSPRLIDN